MTVNRDPNKIQEGVSRAFFRLLAENSGFVTEDLVNDNGTDLCIKRVTARIDVNGNRREHDDGTQLDIQLKSVHESGIEATSSGVSYDLSVKNYNDLIERKKTMIPLALFLVILPDNSDSWIDIQPDITLVKKCIYWYRPDSDQLSENTSTVRIQIPTENCIVNASMSTIYTDLTSMVARAET